MAYTTIDNPELYFQAKAWTGTGSEIAITFDGEEDMQPDLAWLKKRSATGIHVAHDSVRGATKRLIPNATDAETTQAQYVKSFDSDGITFGTDSDINADGATAILWGWKAGTTSGITTNGSTTITPSAYSFNQTSGFSILKYTGNGTGGAKVAHGLGVTPKMFVVKNLGATQDWTVFHQHQNATPEDFGLFFNSTDASTNDGTYWNDGAPDSVNFTVGTNARTNTDSGTYVAYCFADVQGFSKFGGYTGNGNADGTFIYTGFKPAFFITKSVGAGIDWNILDNKRPAYNVADQWLAMTNAAEVATDTTPHAADFLSNGVKLRGSAADAQNKSGQAFVYFAWAEAPFVNSNGVPCNAR